MLILVNTVVTSLAGHFFPVAPIISPFDFDERIFYGESIQVMCHIPKGDMPLTLTWSFQNQHLTNSNNVIITKVGDRSSILAIPAVTDKHSGNYTCTASNIVASTNHTSILNVQGIFFVFVLRIVSYVYSEILFY